jgi:hypothetical protein
VTLDGKPLGSLPHYDVKVSAGQTHRIVFEHPKYGRRERTVTVAADGEQKVIVDLRTPE